MTRLNHRQYLAEPKHASRRLEPGRCDQDSYHSCAPAYARQACKVHRITSKLSPPSPGSNQLNPHTIAVAHEDGKVQRTVYTSEARGVDRISLFARIIGLDAVEIVLNVEDHFGITIQNAEAEHVLTVADLVALIHGRISAAHEAYCPTLPAFLKLRATVRDVTGDNTFRIRPRQRIADRLTVLQRRQLWKRLSELLGSPPRGLRRPQLLRRILGTSVVALLGIASITAVAIDIRIWPVTLAVAAFCIFVLHIVTVPFRNVPPAEWVTFGDIVAKIVGVTFATKLLQLRTADDILCELRPLIVDVLGVDGDEVVPDARFVEDLGVG